MHCLYTKVCQNYFSFEHLSALVYTPYRSGFFFSTTKISTTKFLGLGSASICLFFRLSKVHPTIGVSFFFSTTKFSTTIFWIKYRFGLVANFRLSKVQPIREKIQKTKNMVSQEKLVDFDNEIVLQPGKVVALFFPKAKDAAEENTATKQTFESEDATADEDTAKQTFGNEDTAADEDATNTATKETFEREDAAAADTANTATKQTFEGMGLRCEKNVATHLLLENAYDSNLLSDISKVDYMAGNLGQTNLRPLEGLPAFVDDIFVYGYLSREECVFRKGKLSCTSGEQGAAKPVVASIANALERALGKRGYMQTAIVHTVAAGNSGSSTIRATIAKIEKNTLHKAKRKWEEIHPQKKIAGYFVAKCDVSEVPLEELHSGLHVFEKCLAGYGYGIYSIDYTQDFSGVLDRKALVGHLGSQKAGDFCAAIDEKEPTILENTDIVGEHVCTWIATTEEGHTTRTKINNKVVSNFEAGEIREPVGGHLAEYADCPNQHLRKTFLHPDVQSRGCTRIEVSLYECPQNQLSSKKATDCIEKVLEKVFIEEEDEEEYGLFVVQPPSKQWKNLAESLDRCLVLADRPQGHIFVAWFAHTKTGRIAGIHVRPTEANVRDDAKWEKSILWAAGDFGFRDCPIFRVDIQAADEEGVEIGPLRCYTKDKNARTILAASKKPTQLHPNGGDLSTLLPPTDKIVWEWRDKKCHAIGKASSKYKLQEIQEIAEQRKISALSTRNREKVLAELRYASTVEEWKREKWQIEEKQRKKEEETAKAREAEIANLRKHAETKKKIAEKIMEIRATVVRTLSRMETQKVAELPANKKWDVLGFRGKEGKFRVVLRHGKEAAVAVWATKGLQKILQECLDCFRSDEKDSWGRQLFWLVSASASEKIGGLELHIEPSRSFQNREGKTIVWNPIQVVSAPDSGRLAFLQDLASKCEEYETLRAELAKNCLQKISAPANKATKKTTDLPEGEYICKRFARTKFRNAPRTILFLLPLGEDGEQATDEETPTHGVFLEKEIAAMGGIEAVEKRKTPLLCLLGEEKTTPSKRKCRRVALV